MHLPIVPTLATGQQDPRLAARLLEKGTPVNARDERGPAPFAVAAARGNGKTAELLRGHGGTKQMGRPRSRVDSSCHTFNTRESP
jgi:ankyrin repeat protein